MTFPTVNAHINEETILRILDDPQEWSAFSRPSSDTVGCWESNIVVEGMHCAACSLTIEEALNRVPGVVSAQVGSASHRAKIVWSENEVKPSVWMQAIRNSGYRAVPANDAFASDRRKQETRQALWRWLVAVFCMMQVMMYAYPAYIATPGDLSTESEHLLRWASWVISLPVIVFSCGPFFRNALRDIAQRTISMDFPVALGMGITFLMSTAGTFEPNGIFGHEVYFDSLTMFVAFLLTGRWLELRMRDRTAGALEALVNRLPDSVERWNTEIAQFERVAARRLMVNDILRVHPGETFAADGVLLEGHTLVDESLLTGESHPLPRGVGSPVLSGSHNLSGTVRVRVQQVGDTTRFAQIVALMESASTTKPQSAMLADRLAKPFLIGVLVAAALACAWWWEQDPGHALMVAVAVLVVTCPCALSLATPAAMLATAGTLARNGVLVRRLESLETLAQVNTVIFDKTGTLTRDAMILSHIHVQTGYTKEQALAMAAALAQHSLHPVSRSLVQANMAASITSTWRCDAVTEFAGQGIEGKLETHTLRLGSAKFCGVPNTDNAEGVSLVYLSHAVHPSYPSNGAESGWIATFSLQEDMRPKVAKTVSALQEGGVTVMVLSGDRKESVAEIASRAGIAHFQAECSPDNKLTIMRALQAKGQCVAMVGDGLNDGPVLAGADVSFAFGLGVPLAHAKADFVILGEQITSVVQTIRLAQRTLRIVRQNLWWALIYNIACVPLAIGGWLPAWLAGLGMASSSLLVVLNAMRLARLTPIEKVG